MTDTKRVLTQTFGVVAAILERDGKILLVKENNVKHPDHGKWNHPAGWVDVGENPTEAVGREVAEESGYSFVPRAILGIYSTVRKDLEKNFGSSPHGIKIVYLGDVSEEPEHALLGDTSEAHWFTPEEIYAMDLKTLRDNEIKNMVKSYFAGTRYPLSLVTHTVQH